MQRVGLVYRELDQRAARVPVSVPAPFFRSQFQAPVVGKIAFRHHELANAAFIQDLLDFAATL